MSSKSNEYKAAQKIVKKKKGFYKHLAAFVIINAFIIIMGIVEDGFDFSILDSPLLPWGVGLAFHYLSVFGIPGSDILTRDWENRELGKELRKLKKGEPDLLNKSNDVEIPETPLELKDVKKEQLPRDWDEKDLV